MTGPIIREARAADAPGIRSLFSRTFGTELSEAEWRWKFADDPDGWFGIVAEQEGQIVGNYAGWGMRFLLDGQETLLYSVGDVATDARARGMGRGVYRAMAGAFYETVGSRGVPFCFGFPNARALAISHRLLGSRTLFPVREIALSLDALPPPLLIHPDTHADAGGDAGAGDFVEASFDALWSAARGGISHGAFRDRLRANWRFHGRPTRYYRMVWVGGPAALCSWAVLSVTGEKALVADYLVVDADERERERTFSRLFATAAAEARRLGAHELVFWETPGGPAQEFLSRLPGARRDAGFPLIVRVFDEEKAGRFARGVHLVPALYDVI